MCNYSSYKEAFNFIDNLIREYHKTTRDGWVLHFDNVSQHDKEMFTSIYLRAQIDPYYNPISEILSEADMEKICHLLLCLLYKDDNILQKKLIDFMKSKLVEHCEKKMQTWIADRIDDLEQDHLESLKGDYDDYDRPSFA